MNVEQRVRAQNMLIGGPAGEVRGYTAGKLHVLEHAVDRAGYIDGVRMTRSDLLYALKAIKAAPDDTDRHDDLADGLRAEAGALALKISNAHHRSVILDLVDGWTAMRGALVEETPEGALHEASSEDISARILTVVDPSTRRTYALLVPVEHETVREARAWVNMGIADFDVET